MTANLSSKLPSVDRLLADSKPLCERYGHAAVVDTYRSLTAKLRSTILSGKHCSIPNNQTFIDQATS